MIFRSKKKIKNHLDLIIQRFLIERIKAIESLVLTIKFRKEFKKLSILKAEQKEKFENLKNKFFQYYKELKKYPLNKYITENYLLILQKIEKKLFTNLKFDFLKNPSLKIVMFFTRIGKALRKQLTFLETKYSPEKLKELLIEDYIGCPLLINSKYLTSHNSIHHLYHLTYYQDKTNLNFEKINTVVEWGGGYGNLAKIFKRLLNKNYTYIILDLPLFSCVQWLYLSVIFGEENVNLLLKPEDKIQIQKINLIPVIFRDYHTNIKADMFISTWALNESGKDAQDFVMKLNFYNARHLLMSFANKSKICPDSEILRSFAEKFNAKIYDINFLPGSYYFFR